MMKISIQLAMGLCGNISNKLTTVLITAEGSTITQHLGFYLVYLFVKYIRVSSTMGIML